MARKGSKRHRLVDIIAGSIVVIVLLLGLIWTGIQMRKAASASKCSSAYSMILYLHRAVHTELSRDDADGLSGGEILRRMLETEIKEDDRSFLARTLKYRDPQDSTQPGVVNGPCDNARTRPNVFFLSSVESEERMIEVCFLLSYPPKCSDMLYRMEVTADGCRQVEPESGRCYGDYDSSIRN